MKKSFFFFCSNNRAIFMCFLYFIIVFSFMYNNRIENKNFARENSTSFFDSLRVWGVINAKTLNVDTLTKG